MAELIGASEAMASEARGKLRSENSGGGAMNAAFASYVAAGLTPPMREKLRRRQADMFGPPVVVGSGMTLKALRRRGVIEGKTVPRVTELGELVIRAAGLDGAEAADG